jgi:hypothetical protein
LRDLFANLDRQYPHLQEHLLAAMSNIDPSRLLDTRFLHLEGGAGQGAFPVLDSDES